MKKPAASGSSVPRPAKATFRLSSGAVCCVRPAKVSDAAEATELIHDAFEVWKAHGLRLGPMSQTVEQTRRHLKGKGVVAADQDGRLLGTFSLEEGRLRRRGDGRIAFREGADVVSYEPVEGGRLPRTGRYLVFKKAAVASRAARSGLGTRLYELAERTARERGYDGMILETVREAVWLYDWYVRLGFRPIATCRYPGSQVDTVLMLKDFRDF